MVTHLLLKFVTESIYFIFHAQIFITKQYAEVQCVDPLSVKDGFIEGSNFKGRYVFGSLATYHCNPGYILWGNASRLCAENGKWTGKDCQ